MSDKKPDAKPKTPKVKKVRCEYCEKWFPESKVIVGPNPFAYEVYDDDTETKLCEQCYENSRGDI